MPINLKRLKRCNCIWIKCKVKHKTLIWLLMISMSFDDDVWHILSWKRERLFTCLRPLRVFGMIMRNTFSGFSLIDFYFPNFFVFLFVFVYKCFGKSANFPCLNFSSFKSVFCGFLALFVSKIKRFPRLGRLKLAPQTAQGQGQQKDLNTRTLLPFLSTHVSQCISHESSRHLPCSISKCVTAPH